MQVRIQSWISECQDHGDLGQGLSQTSPSLPIFCEWYCPRARAVEHHGCGCHALDADLLPTPWKSLSRSIVVSFTGHCKHAIACACESFCRPLRTGTQISTDRSVGTELFQDAFPGRTSTYGTSPTRQDVFGFLVKTKPQSRLLAGWAIFLARMPEHPALAHRTWPCLPHCHCQMWSHLQRLAPLPRRH